jgi:hypothetical protein
MTRRYNYTLHEHYLIETKLVITIKLSQTNYGCNYNKNIKIKKMHLKFTNETAQPYFTV